MDHEEQKKVVLISVLCKVSPAFQPFHGDVPVTASLAPPVQGVDGKVQNNNLSREIVPS
jgi:hypothetical protein